MLATLLSTFLLTAPINPSLEIIKEHHLDSAEGRSCFLTEKLSPFIAAGSALNEEIMALSKKVQELSAETDGEEILSLSSEVALKSESMAQMLPCIQAALHVDADFQCIDAILENEESLCESDQEIADRLAMLCQAIDKYSEK